MSFPSGAIWNCRSGFGICLRHTTTLRATADAKRKRTLFQASQVRGSIRTFKPASRFDDHVDADARHEARKKSDSAFRRTSPPVFGLATGRVRSKAARTTTPVGLRDPGRRTDPGRE